MASAESDKSQFDELLLAVDSELNGELSQPVLLDTVDPELRKKLDDATDCLLLLKMTREYSAADLALAQVDLREDDSGSEWRVGSRIQRFQLTLLLGSGGFADVFLAHDTLLDRQVAIKVPHARWKADVHLIQRFHREARVMGQLRHPAIVSVFETGEHNGSPFLVMEYCVGGNLEQYLNHLPQRLDPRACASLIYQIADGLCLAHRRGVLHRDIKTRNVLIASCPPSDLPAHAVLESFLDVQPKLSDFGLAKWSHDENADDLTQSGQMTGTLNYMAPEQAAGKSEHVSPATDVHGLGVILYEMLTGQYPFHGESQVETSWNILHKEPLPVRTLRPAVHRDLETICHKALEKDPGKRYPTAVEMTQDLRCFLEDRPIHSKPVSFFERHLRWSRKNPVLTLLMSIIAIAFMLISGGGWWYSSRLYEAVETETAYLDAARMRESNLVQQEATLRQTIQRERSLTYVARMRNAQSLYDRGNYLTYAAELTQFLEDMPYQETRLDFSWRMMVAKCGGRIRPLDKIINNDFRAVNVIKDRNLIVGVGYTGSVSCWELESGLRCDSPLPLLSGFDSYMGVLFQPRPATWILAINRADGQTTSSGDLDFWNPETRARKSLTAGHYITDMKQSADRQRFVLNVRSHFALDFPQAQANEFQVYSSDTGERLWTVTTDIQRDLIVDWGPDGSLAIPAMDQLRIYNSQGDLRAELNRTPDNSPLRIISCAFASDGTQGAGLREDLSVDIWKRSSTDNYSFDRTIAITEAPARLAKNHWPERYAIRFLDGDKSIAFCGPDHRVHLWNLQTNQRDGQSPPFSNPVDMIFQKSDGSLILHESQVGIHHWIPSVADTQFAGHSLEAWSIEFSPSGKYLVSSSDDGTIKLWDVRTGRELFTSTDHTLTVTNVRYSPSGSRIASMCLDGSLRVWEVNPSTGIPDSEPSLEKEHRKGRSLAWSKNGRSLATGGNDGEVLIWDVEKLQVMRRIKDHEFTVRQILFIDDDQTLLSGANGRSVCFHDLKNNGQLLKRWQFETNVCSIALLPDADTVAIGLMDGKIILRSRSSDQLVGRLTGHEAAVFSMSLSPDGRVLASGDEAGWLRLWNVENRQLVVSMHIGEHKINGLAFSPQNDAIAIATHDGKVRVWGAPFVK